MARNGSGVYNLLTNSWNPAINGVSATAADWQNLINDVAAALTQSLSADGQTPMTGNLNAGNNKLTGLAAGSATGDSLRWEQLFSQGQPANLASATTTDIGAQNTVLLNITGTTTITSFGTNYNGPRYLRFDGVLTLTHNSTTLILPGGANITTAAGDSAIVVPNGTPANGWRVVGYQRSDGSILLNGSVTTAKLADGVLSADATGRAKMADNFVTLAKLDSSARLLDTNRTDVASATTVDLTALVPNTRHINITGTTTITGFTVANSLTYFVRFNASLTLTNNANIITQTGSNITTQAGDTCILRAISANVVEVLSYVPAKNSSQVGTAPVFGARAWVNFNGTGTVAIRASGNVSSVTDISTGEYTVNFTTGFPDNNYAVLPTAAWTSAVPMGAGIDATSSTASGVRVITWSGVTPSVTDSIWVSVAIFR